MKLTFGAVLFCTFLHYGLAKSAGSGLAGLVYSDFSSSQYSGLHYKWTEQELFNVEEMLAKGAVNSREFQFLAGAGFPGVILLDIDNDGDTDIYATAYQGDKNHLYKNLLTENGDGILTFTEVSDETGMALLDHDSSGVCYGDIENDGDMDVMVLSGWEMGYRMMENDGTGHFTDITVTAGLNDGQGAVSCSFGDVNGDGYGDLYIGLAHEGNGGGCENRGRNALFMNNGDATFVLDTTRGLSDFEGLTWAVALVDYDQDGDLDAFDADDGCMMQQATVGDVGFMRLHVNDGTGHFTDMTAEKSVKDTGGYMGLSFADYNSDGYIDAFVTDIGHWSGDPFLANFSKETVPARNSRWLLNNAEGYLDDQDVNAELGFTPFGWGAVSIDLDNSGSTDIIFHGGILSNYFIADNPGCALINDGHATFLWDDKALNRDHRPRNVHGVATADLNHDGFPDVVSVSNIDFTVDTIITFNSEFPDSLLPFGSAFDDVVGFNPHLIRNDPATWYWNDIPRTMGSLIVEISSGNDNNYITATPIGGFGLVTGAKAPRDGFGTIFRFTPDAEDALTATVPVIGGDSQGSQSEPMKTLGLASATSGLLEVQWLGGTRNRYYDVPAGENLIVYELPCSISSTEFTSAIYFLECVDSALEEMKMKGLIDAERAEWMRDSQARGFTVYNSAFEEPVDGDSSSTGGDSSSTGGSGTFEGAMIGTGVVLAVVGTLFFVRYRRRVRYSSIPELPQRSTVYTPL